MIVIVDYGMGNLRSVQKGLEFLGYASEISSKKEVLDKASGLILPGVGAFGKAMENLWSYGLVDSLKGAIDAKKPFLGICLGMQLLLETSSEHGPVDGISVVKGSVKGFIENKQFGAKLAVPHMGWNEVNIKKDSPLFKGVDSGFQAYFVHSYYADPAEDITIGETDYDISFCSALEKDNLFGLQFHPEKSGEVGLKILKNFSDLC